MTSEEFRAWCEQTGYTTINDWNYQEIDGYSYYFIKHSTKNVYALIKQRLKARQVVEQYQVLVEGWTDYNGWKPDF